MKRDIVQLGEAVLRQTAREVTLEELASAEIQTLIADMRETMRAAPGVGLAAPQVGIGLRIAVIEDPAEAHAKVSAKELAEREREAVPFHVLVNPVVTARTEERVEAFEGCLSFSGFSMLVPRIRKVRVEALDEHGQPVVKVATGWYARIIQHEVDHLNGIVCCDRMAEAGLSRTLVTTANLAKHWAGRTVAEIRAGLLGGN